MISLFLTDPETLVLEYLKACPSGRTITQIAKAYPDHSMRRLSEAVRRLEKQGLVDCEYRGHTKYFAVEVREPTVPDELKGYSINELRVIRNKINCILEAA